jgi:hypothetical protein
MFALEPLLRVERIRFGLGQIQRSGDVLVLALELVDGAVERGDLGGALGQPGVVGVGAHHGRVDEIDDAEVGGLGLRMSSRSPSPSTNRLDESLRTRRSAT